MPTFVVTERDRRALRGFVKSKISFDRRYPRAVRDAELDKIVRAFVDRAQAGDEAALKLIADLTTLSANAE